jgi:hypothetical protein
MKQTIKLLGMLSLCLATPALAQQAGMDMESGMPMGMDHSMMTPHAGTTMGAKDPRISLGMSVPMRLKQLAMMRDHLKAVDEIVGLIAAGKFDKAATIAHKRLGLTPEMKKMCGMFGNETFRKMGIAFHKSADHLGDVLKTRDTTASLHALHSTMQYCVSCHQSFRQ